jgi:hypothetical protein
MLAFGRVLGLGILPRCVYILMANIQILVCLPLIFLQGFMHLECDFLIVLTLNVPVSMLAFGRVLGLGILPRCVHILMTNIQILVCLPLIFLQRFMHLECDFLILLTLNGPPLPPNSGHE